MKNIIRIFLIGSFFMTALSFADINKKLFEITDYCDKKWCHSELSRECTKRRKDKSQNLQFLHRYVYKVNGKQSMKSTCYRYIGDAKGGGIVAKLKCSSGVNAGNTYTLSMNTQGGKCQVNEGERASCDKSRAGQVMAVCNQTLKLKNHQKSKFKRIIGCSFIGSGSCTSAKH